MGIASLDKRWRTSLKLYAYKGRLREYADTAASRLSRVKIIFNINLHTSVTKFPSSISVRERQQLAATATAVGRIPLREEGQPGPRLPHRQHGLHQRAQPPAALLRWPLQPVRPSEKSGKLRSILHLSGKQEDGSAATGTTAEGITAKATVGKGGSGAEAADAAEDEKAAAAAAEAEPEADEEEATAPETDSVDGLLICF